MPRIRICSRSYELKFTTETSGGSFWCSGKHGKGDGTIEIGKYDLHHTGEILIHEALESIFTEDKVRLSNPNYQYGNDNLIFHFNHQYFDSIGPKLLDALLSSGMFKLVDIRPKNSHRQPRRRDE